ncbi:MAG: TlpA disulfide reductase family protein [Saprospiraceae bacterium]
MLRIQTTLLIAIVMVLTINCKSGHTAYKPSQEVSLTSRLENIKMTDIDGRPFTLHALGGKPVFLNFWATWCRPCISEMRSMEELYQKYKGKAVFLAVTTEDISKIKEFKAKNDFHFDFAKLDVEYIDAFVITLPTTFLIDRSGKLVYEEEGARVWTSFNNEEKFKEIIR